MPWEARYVRKTSVTCFHSSASPWIRIKRKRYICESKGKTWGRKEASRRSIRTRAKSLGVDVVALLHIHDRNYLCDIITIYNECILREKKNLAWKDNRRGRTGIVYPTLREQVICLKEETLPFSDEALSLSPSKPWVCQLLRTGAGGQDTARCSRRVCFLLEAAALCWNVIVRAQPSMRVC